MKSFKNFVILYALLWTCVFSPVTSYGKTNSTSKKTIIVGADIDYPPYSYLDENQRPAGFDIDLMREVVKGTDYQIEFALMKWETALEKLEKDEIDVLIAMIRTDERSKLFTFTIPYHTTWYTLFAQKGTSFNSFQEIEDKEVITMKGDASIENLLEPLGVIDKITYTDTLPQAFKLLDQGHHDYVLAPNALGYFLINSNKNPNFKLTHEIVPIGPQMSPSLYRAGLKRGNLELLSFLNESFDRFKRNGRLKQISDKWFSDHLTHSPFSWNYYIIALVISVIILLLIGSRTFSYQLQKRIAQFQKESSLAISSSKAKSLSIANFSHDIRSSLNSILGFSDILKQESSNNNLPSEIQEYALNLSKSTEKLSTLMDDFQQIFLIDSGTAKACYESTDIKKIINNICAQAKPEALKKGVFFSLGLDSSLPEIIITDPIRFKTILSNLLQSTVDLTPEGKSIWLKVKKQDQWLSLEVSSEGFTIDQHSHQFITNPFSVSASVRKPSIGSPGLGFAAINKHVQLLDGTFTIRSESQDQILFTVKIPIIKSI